MLNNLEAVILRDSLVASACTTVLSAVELMADRRNSLPEKDLHSGFVVVVTDDQQVLGVLTERDVVSLVAQRRSIEQLTLGEFLGQGIQPRILRVLESALTDVKAVTEYFEQEQITHLAIVNQQNQLAGIITDESLRRLSQAQLQESEQRYASLLGNLPGFVYRELNDSNYTPVYISPGVTAITGYLPEEYLVDRTVSCGQLICPEDLEQVGQSVQAALARRGSFECEYRIIDKLGQEKWLWERGQGTYNAAGELLYLEGFITDISDRKAAESLLASQQQILERIAKAEPLTNILETLLLKMEAHLSGTICSITLCQDGRLGAVTAPSLPQDYAMAVMTARLPISEGVGSCGTAAFRRELVVVTDISSDPLWQNYKSLVLCYGLQACSSIPIFASDRTLLGVFGIYYYEQKAPQAQELEWIAQAANIAGIAIERDRATHVLQQLNQELEDRVQARTQELQEREQFLQTVLNTFPLSVFWKDINSVYLGCNQNFLRDAGLQTIDQIIGKTDYELSWGETEAEIYRADDRGVIERQTAKLGIVETQQQADGQTVWVETNKLPLRNLQGEVIGVMGTYQDITDRKSAELALQASEAKFRRITESGPGMIFRYVLHPDGRDELAYVSPQVQQIYELTPEAVLQDINVLWARVHPEDKSDMFRAIQHSADSLQLFFIEVRLLLPRMLVKWIQISCQPDLQENGDIIWDGVVIDVTDRKKLEQEQTKLTAILEATPDYIGIANAQGEILWHNKQLRKLRPELSSRDEHRVVSDCHPDWANKIIFEQALPTAIREGSWSGESALLDGTGGEIPVSQVIIAHKSADGTVENFSTIMRDISDSKAAEKALILKQNHLAALLNNIPHMAWIKDEKSCFIAVNEPFAQACGVPVEELVGKTDYDIWPVDLAQSYQYNDAEVLQFGQRKVVEEQAAFADGTLGWLETTKTPFRDAQQAIAGTVGIAADITDRKNAEAKINQQMAAIEAAIDGIAILRNGLYLYLNQAHVDLYGYASATELIGQSWRILYSQTELDRLDQEVFPQLVRDRSWQGESISTRKDGSWFHAGLSLTLTDDDLLICVCRDIGDRKEYEQQLERSNAELIRATRLKDEFLANMSHELRTPLNAILGMTEILQEEVFGAINERQQKSLQTIEKSSHHLLELINDILDVAKIEAGQVELFFQPTNIEALCQSSLAFIKQQACHKKIQLELVIRPALPEMAIDERRIRQVLINLLNNAVKFTPNGGKITLQVNYRSGADPVLEISVSDTGIGIPPEQMNRLFQPFVQVESALNRNYGGTGLGLALVKQLVELHGGTVGLTSELGVGSCFTFTIPVVSLGSDVLGAEPALPMIAEMIAPVQDSVPVVLLAEDNEANINMLVDYLSLKGYRLVVATNGQMAIEMAQQTRPDIILMDIQMPGMDGLEAIEKIRQNSELADTPIIALTALVMSGDRERCLAAGANDYLSKPVQLKQLVNQINGWLKVMIA